MNLIADILLLAGAIGAGLYCHVLSQRLRNFTDLEKGVGGAVAVLSAQVDDLTRSITSAKEAASGSVATLSDVSDRAEIASRHLELLIASLHDMPRDTAAEERDNAPPLNPFFVHARSGAERPQ